MEKGKGERGADPKERWGLYRELRDRADQEKDPADTLIRLANLCIELGQKEEALVYYRRALDLDPGNVYVVRKLRELYPDTKKSGLEGIKSATEISSETAGELYLWNLITYTFRKGRIVMPVIGAIFMNLPLLGIFMGPLVIVFFPQVIRNAACGRKDLPDWPVFIGPVSFIFDILIPSFVIALLLGFPMSALYILSRSGAVSSETAMYLRHLVVVYVVYSPMALMMFSLGKKDFMTFNILLGIRSVFRLGLSYVRMLAWFVVFLVSFEIYMRSGFLKNFFWGFVMLCSGIIYMRVIGLTYRLKERALGW